MADMLLRQCGAMVDHGIKLIKRILGQEVQGGLLNECCPQAPVPQLLLASRQTMLDLDVCWELPE
jgi:hypothetical protein